MIDWWMIEKQIQGKATAEEAAAVKAWLEGVEEGVEERAEAGMEKKRQERRALYARMVRAVREGKLPESSEEEYARWRERFRARVAAERGKRRRLRIMRWSSVAAVVVAGWAGGYWLYREAEAEKVEIAGAVQQPAEEAGGAQGIRLVTASGEVVELSMAGGADTLVVDGRRVARGRDGLNYYQSIKGGSRGNEEWGGERDGVRGGVRGGERGKVTGRGSGGGMEGLETGAKGTLLAENRLEIPRGAEYRLTLEDGTQVWLNSVTELTYPVAFTGERREVKLEGEAYFEVARDEERPFIVHTKGVAVEVLGTEFNVRARREEVLTTLVQGSVLVAGEGEGVVLTPGETAATNVATGETRTRRENIQRYVAWREGRFCFEDATVEEMMGELALWYDVEVRYANEAVKRERFSGYLPRTADIGELLRRIEQTTYVHFTKEGRCIQVSN